MYHYYCFNLIDAYITKTIGKEINILKIYLILLLFVQYPSYLLFCCLFNILLVLSNGSNNSEFHNTTHLKGEVI